MTDHPAADRVEEALSAKMRVELDRLLVDAHGVPDDERDRWAARLARVRLDAVRSTAPATGPSTEADDAEDWGDGRLTAPATGPGLREGDDDGSTLAERLADVATGTVTGMTERRIERIVRDADYALRALERGDVENARAALRRGFQRAPVALRAATEARSTGPADCRRSEAQASWCAVHDSLYPPHAIRCNGATEARSTGDPVKCAAAITAGLQAGRPCLRNARPGSRFCGMHEARSTGGLNEAFARFLAATRRRTTPSNNPVLATFTAGWEARSTGGVDEVGELREALTHVLSDYGADMGREDRAAIVAALATQPERRDAE